MLIVYFQIFIFQLKLEPFLFQLLYLQGFKLNSSSSKLFQGTFQHGSMELVDNEFMNQRKNQFEDGTHILPGLKNSICFNNVSFRYSGSNFDTLKNINLKI